MNQSHTEETTPALVSITKIKLDFVSQTLTLSDFDGPVAIYRPERTGFDIHIVASDPREGAPEVPVRDLSYYNELLRPKKPKKGKKK